MESRVSSNRLLRVLSEQQLKAGKEVFESFDQGLYRWCVLLAQMQSGKTECYLFCCCECIRKKIVDNVVIFSGNTDIDLRDQLKTEVEGKKKC